MIGITCVLEKEKKHQSRSSFDLNCLFHDNGEENENDGDEDDDEGDGTSASGHGGCYEKREM